MKKTATCILICTVMAGMAFAQKKPAEKKETPAPAATEKKTDDTQVVYGPSIKWEVTTWDFGKVTQHVPATKEFVFYNNGTVPIIIEAVTPSCNCTAGDYSKEPVMPGKKGYVKLTFNAAMPGQFNKSASVKTSAGDSPEILSMKGVVIVIPDPK